MTRGRKRQELSDSQSKTLKEKPCTHSCCHLVYEKSDDGSGKVRCTLCSKHCPLDYRGNFIAQRSQRAHEQSAVHLRAVALEAEAEERIITSAESMTRRMEERDYIAPSSIVKGLLPRHSKQQLEHRESSLERQMWKTLEFQGADISAGDDPDTLREQQRKDFEARLDRYGLWDSLEQPISNIDLVAPEHSWAADEDEDVLNDILANAGQSNVYKVAEQILTLCCKWALSG